MMKNTFKTTIVLFIALTALVACKKKTDNPMDFTIDDQNLTACLPGVSCSYEYANYSSMQGDGFALITGQNRIFWVKNEKPSITTWIFIQAPMIGDKFLLTEADIRSGKIKYLISCPACLAISPKLLGGTVKGIKVTEVNTTSEKWLIDAHIITKFEGSTIPVDTIHIKQYFNLAVK